MVVNTPDGAGIENVLVSLQPDGTYKEFLVHYNVTDEEIIMMNNNQEVDLTNKLTFTELNTNFASNTAKILIGDNGCIYDVAYYSSTCNEAGHTWNEVYEQGIHCNASIQPTREGVMSLLSCPATGGGGNPDSTTNNTSSNSASSNTGNSTAVITCNPKNGPCIEVPDCGATNQVAALTTALGLSQEVTDCLLETDNCTNAQALFTFHNANLTETAFSKAAAQAICNGGEVDFDEQIIISNNLKNNNCLNSVYTSMSTGVTFGDYLNNFDGTMSVANLLLTSNTTMSSGTNAETSAPQNYLITITFNENNLDRPSLSVARTFIHEIIHAEIFRKLLSVAQHPSILLTQSQIIQLRNDYPGLYDYYMRWKWNLPQGQTATSAQHQAMAEHYRDIIELALREYDDTQTDEVYNSLAWTGLENTVAWNNLSQLERDNINQNLSDFYLNNPNCQ